MHNSEAFAQASKKVSSSEVIVEEEEIQEKKAEERNQEETNHEEAHQKSNVEGEEEVVGTREKNNTEDNDSRPPPPPPLTEEAAAAAPISPNSAATAAATAATEAKQQPPQDQPLSPRSKLLAQSGISLSEILRMKLTGAITGYDGVSSGGGADGGSKGAGLHISKDDSTISKPEEATIDVDRDHKEQEDIQEKVEGSREEGLKINEEGIHGVADGNGKD
jgi:hypothetical protein